MIKLTQKQFLMTIKPIKTESQYEDSLKRIYELIQKDVKPNSKDSDELEILSILVKDYENEVYPMDKPNPIEAIKFRLEQLGVTEAFLSRIIGTSRKSEILSGSRKLNLSQIRKISKNLNISADILVQEY